MRRIILNRAEDEKALRWAMRVHSKQEDGASELNRKFFLAHFLSDYIDNDKSIIRLCFLHGLLPSVEIEEDMKSSFSKDESFVKEAFSLSGLVEAEMEKLTQIIKNASHRESMVIAGYVALQFCTIEDGREENISFAPSYEEKKAHLSLMIYSLMPKIPKRLFEFLEEKLQEVFFEKKQLYFGIK